MWLGGGSPAKWDPAVNMVQSYLIVNNAANTEPGHGKEDNFREIYDVSIKMCTGHRIRSNPCKVARHSPKLPGEVACSLKHRT